MSEINQKLRERLSFLSDESLLDLMLDKAGDYTPEAVAIINEEIDKRGGLEDLKRNVDRGRDQNSPATVQDTTSARNLAIAKRFYPFLVVAAYGAFMYVLDASAWFYWLCLFGLIAWLFAVLFRPRFKPEDEIRELLSKASAEAGSSPPGSHPGGDEAS